MAASSINITADLVDISNESMLGSLNTSMEDDDCLHGHRTSTPLSNYVEPDFNLENNDNLYSVRLLHYNLM